MSLLAASVLAPATSTPSKEPPQLLKEQDVKDPEFVVQWLSSAESKTDQKDAKWFFSIGLKEKKSKNWPAASKAFGESMRRYPSPQALFEYADSDLKMLGQVRAREGFPPGLVREDMVHALRLYETSLAANKVTNTLSAQEAKRIEQHASCLKNYLESSAPQSDCQPLKYFSSERVNK
jgi:hypothetical protein